MQKKYTTYLIFFLCIANAVLFAQTNRMLRLQALTALESKDWFGATQYYARLFASDSTNIKQQYNYADASRLNFDIDIALKLYGKIAIVDNGRRFPLTFYWMGQLLKNKGRYKDAKKWFVKFSKLKLTKPKYSYYNTKAKLEAEACDLAQIMIKNPSVSNVEHLDAIINSKESEYAPFEKDSTLYFSSLKNPVKKDANQTNFNKIYRSDIKNQKWQKVKALDTAINATYMHNANTCFSNDYKQMIVSRCVEKNASEYNCELYISNFVNNKWKPLQKMDEPLNMLGASTSQPAFGDIDGKTVLFFASNRPGGEGGLDIWYSFKNDNGTYSDPVNAGKSINTPDDEITPWFVSSSKTLFFSSTYHKGLGGFDIFKSNYRNNEFSEPQNAGYPINSSYNDIYYSVNKGNTRAYLSSNRVGSFFESKLNCCNDIYRFNLITAAIETPKAIDSTFMVKEQMRLLVPLTLYFHNDEPDPKTKNITTTKNYETTYNDYFLLKPQYLKEFSSGLKGTTKDIAINTIDNFFEDSVSAGFEDLKRFTALLEKVLLNGETVKITMKGYCSPLASTDYNKNLAKRRISSLRNFFTETKGGMFAKYINNQAAGTGKIIFEDVDIGELVASRASDDFKDRRNSVYSPYAASERRIQIIAVSFGR